MKEHSTWEVFCKWTKWDSTFTHLIPHLLFSFNTDAYDAEHWRKQYRWCRCTVSRKCIASEQSKISLFHIVLLIYALHFTQMLTTLNLHGNNIGAPGAQYLGNALQVNTVRLYFPAFHPPSKIFILSRHWPRWIFNWTILAMKEPSIWEMHWKWTQ